MVVQSGHLAFSVWRQGRSRKGGGVMESAQLFQVWDWTRNQPHSFHREKVFAEETAAKLNADNATDANGLPRWQVMEAND